MPGRGKSQPGNERGRLGKRRAKRAAAPAARAGPSRLERQRSMTLEEILEDLPRQCDKGAKKNAQGYKVAWNGCQCPADVADGGIPVSCVVTAVSVHDSQVAIPLATLKAERKQGEAAAGARDLPGSRGGALPGAHDGGARVRTAEGRVRRAARAGARSRQSGVRRGSHYFGGW